MDAGARVSIPGRARWARRVASVVLAVVLAIVLLPPLVLRGPVARWAVSRATRDLCGTVHIEGAHLGWLVVPALLRGRPFLVQVQGARIDGADGKDVLRAESVSAMVEVARKPWRVVVDGGVASRGGWRIGIDPEGRVGGLLGAFRVVAPGASRGVCLEPVAPRRGPRPPVAPSSASLELRAIRLDEVDVTLDFPLWGLFLPHARGTGSLAVGTPGGAGFTFDVLDATAPGGELRVGPGGAAASSATTTAFFDDVVISHVGVSTKEPGDLVLTVTRADTGRSRLSGTALFDNVFSRHGRRGDRNPAGLDLDARWDRLSDAAARLRAPWLPRAALGEVLDGALVARVRGPFRALTGTLSIEGPRLGVEAALEQGRRATLDARVSELEISPFLHQSLAALFGGRVTGRLSTKVELRDGGHDVDLEIPSADVVLTRAGKSPTPRRLAFRVRPRTSGAPALAGNDTLVIGLTAANLRHRSLRIEGLSAGWGRALRARGALTLVMPARAGGGPTPPARLDAELTASATSLERWVPRADAQRARVGAAHPLRAARPPSRARRARARDRGDVARRALPRARRRHGRPRRPPRAHVRGPRARARRRRAAHGARPRRARGAHRRRGRPVRLPPRRPCPASRRSPCPPLMNGAVPRRSTTRSKDGSTPHCGCVGADVAAHALAGTITLAGVSLVGRHIGDGKLRVHASGETLSLDGTLGSSLAIDLGARRGRGGVSSDVNLKLASLALAPWLPPPLSGLDVSVSGVARLAIVPRQPLAAHVDLTAGGAGGQLAIVGTSAGDTVDASVRGRLELPGLRLLWGHAFTEADGALDVDVAPSPGGLLRGTLVVARALSLRPRRWPVTLGVAQGGRLEVDGTRLHIPALTLTAPGAWLTLAGDVTADLVTPERTRVDLTANAHVDAAALARQARLPALASASGTITVDARARGTLAAPEASGAARLDAVRLRPTSPAWPALRVDGVLDANERGVSTRGLRVETVGPSLASGVVTIGAADAPASVALTSAWPPRIARVDVPVVGRGLHVGGAPASFAIGALDLRPAPRGRSRA